MRRREGRIGGSGAVPTDVGLVAEVKGAFFPYRVISFPNRSSGPKATVSVFMGDGELALEVREAYIWLGLLFLTSANL